jgi:hypothetical protein
MNDKLGRILKETGRTLLGILCWYSISGGTEECHEKPQ